MTAQVLLFPGTGSPHHRTALDRLHCFVQPIVELASGRVEGFELLARAGGAGRLLTPDEFLPGLRQRGQLPALDLKMAIWATEIHAAIPTRMKPSLKLHLNLCPEAINDADFIGRLARVLVAEPDLTSSVVIEVTEDPGLEITSLDHLRSLRRLGARVALDDFGAGYASYERLSGDAFNLIKLDRRLISQISTSPRARSVLTSLIGLAEEIDVDLIAEGIESALQQRMLQDLGCRFGQGYHCGRPFAATGILQALGCEPAQSWGRLQ